MLRAQSLVEYTILLVAIIAVVVVAVGLLSVALTTLLGNAVANVTF